MLSPPLLRGTISHWPACGTIIFPHLTVFVTLFFCPEDGDNSSLKKKKIGACLPYHTASRPRIEYVCPRVHLCRLKYFWNKLTNIEQVIIAVAPLTSILEVLRSNLGRDKCYSSKQIPGQCFY